MPLARLWIFFFATLLVADAPAPIEWRAWSDDVFAQAKRENKFVLLDLEAVWCHWCHVMAETTYKDPKVVALMRSKYIAVRVDQDSRPDLSNRYEDYGWPATVVFDGKGQEIIKRSGYIAPTQMAAVLQAIIDDPSPGPSVRPEPPIQFGKETQLTPALRAGLRKSYVAQYDSKYGSWGFGQKFLEWNSAEYAFALALQGDPQNERMFRQTLTAQLQLVDPVWGGVYQYSTGGDWKEPHFEKIMAMQAENLRIYALGYTKWKDPSYLKAAQDIERFLSAFLMSPEGAFYTSQDADIVEGEHSAAYFALNDAGRRKQGVPRVDKHVYARENGWAINALATLYAATGDAKYLNQATKAANWIVKNRALDGGGFRHDSRDTAGPYLGDTLAMGRAFLQLYAVTGDRAFLGRAEDAAKFIVANFRDPAAGFLTTKTPTDHAYKPHPERDENIVLARFANLLYRYTAQQSYRAIRSHATRYLDAPGIAKFLPTGGVLLADLEASTEPLHITIVGPKDSPAARSLFLAASAYPGSYKRVEWWDPREGALPNPDVTYPERKEPSAFVCTGSSCSAPIVSAAALRARVDHLTARDNATK